MGPVRIAQFKSRLSHYLSCVRKGDEIVVMDRRTPIARVVPYGGAASMLAMTPARSSPKLFRKLKIPPPPRGTDSLKALIEDRRDDLEG